MPRPLPNESWVVGPQHLGASFNQPLLFSRLAARKQELEEILHDMEARIEEEEEKTKKDFRLS